MNKMKTDPYYTALGSFFKKLREKNGWTYEEVAKPLGRSRGWYYDIEKGRNAVRVGDASKLCYLFGVTLNEMQAYIDGQLDNIEEFTE